jgi:hypothetical protein
MTRRTHPGTEPRICSYDDAPPDFRGNRDENGESEYGAGDDTVASVYYWLTRQTRTEVQLGLIVSIRVEGTTDGRTRAPDPSVAIVLTLPNSKALQRLAVYGHPFTTCGGFNVRYEVA